MEIVKTTYKGIELLPVGTKVKFNGDEWTVGKHNKHSYRLDYNNFAGTVRGRAYVAYEKTEQLRKTIV